MVVQERSPKGRETWSEPGIDCEVQERCSGLRDQHGQKLETEKSRDTKVIFC